MLRLFSQLARSILIRVNRLFQLTHSFFSGTAEEIGMLAEMKIGLHAGLEDQRLTINILHQVPKAILAHQHKDWVLPFLKISANAKGVVVVVVPITQLSVD